MATSIVGIFKEIQAGIVMIAAKAVGSIDKLDQLSGDRVFGGTLRGLANFMEQDAGRIFAEGEKLVKSAFAGEPGQKFLERVEKANQRAKEAAQAIANGQQQPPAALPQRAAVRANVAAVQRGTTAAFEAERRGREHLVNLLKVNREQLMTAKETKAVLDQIEAQFDEGLIDITTRSL